MHQGTAAENGVGYPPHLASARFTIVGNPDSLRVAQFSRAVRAAGHAEPQVVSWLTLLRLGPEALDVLPDQPLLVRLESPGEDFAVERALLRRGYERVRALGLETALAPEAIDALPFEPGRIHAPRQAHEGFLAALDDIEHVARQRPGWRLLSPLWAIREMFDKRATATRLHALGLPHARPLARRLTAGELRDSLRDQKVAAAWIKLTCGSSASCLALWKLAGPTETLITTMDVTPRGFYNSRDLRRYARAQIIERIVDFILQQGAHVEEDVPKAIVRDRWTDCRVVVVAGEPQAVVVRSSRYPVTNLHLGARRGDATEVMARCPPGVFEAAMESCRALARSYGALHVGIDLAFTSAFQSHVVLEANAFGDFLYGFSEGGSGIYAAEIREALRGS